MSYKLIFKCRHVLGLTYTRRKLENEFELETAVVTLQENHIKNVFKIVCFNFVYNWTWKANRTVYLKKYHNNYLEKEEI